MFGVQLIAAVQTSPGNPGTPGTPATVITENPEEWIELYNRSSTETINLSGWQFAEAINYVFPAGTLIAPGEYLVVANDAAKLSAKYPLIRVLGDFSGGLNNNNDRIVLIDAVGNTADEVHYYENGRWASAADGDGSSLELRNPDADNGIGEAWSASDESDSSTWASYTYRGIAEASTVGPDGVWQEFILGLLDSGEVLLDDVSVLEFPGTASQLQLLLNGSFEFDNLGGPASGWRIIGNHRHSEVIVDADDPTNQVLRWSRPVRRNTCTITPKPHLPPGARSKTGENTKSRSAPNGSAEPTCSIRGSISTGSRERRPSRAAPSSARRASKTPSTNQTSAPPIASLFMVPRFQVPDSRLSSRHLRTIQTAWLRCGFGMRSMAARGRAWQWSRVPTACIPA